MKPIIKYAGGKRNEIKFFKKWLDIDFEIYAEPFFGGGAVYFYLEPQKAILNDINVKLINLYNTIAWGREDLIEELKKMDNNEAFYYNARQMFNNEIPSIYTDAALYAYLNRTCFSGMVRYSRGKWDNNSKKYIEQPKYNVPYGKYKTYHPWDFFTQESSDLLKKAWFLSNDFEYIFDLLDDEEDAFIFLDPPYMSQFRSYNPDGFTEEDQIRLAKRFKKTKAKCLLIISDLGIIRELYKDYIKDEYNKTYAFNVKDRIREGNQAKHLIIANYDI